MNRVDLLSLPVLVAVAQLAAAQIPPRYEIIPIEDDPDYNGRARMNNHSQVVYCVDYWTSRDVVLYDNGETIRLTDDPEWDSLPDINDSGQIVWARQVNGPDTPWQIMLLDGGQRTQLTFSDRDNSSPRINNQGHIVWRRYMGEGDCGVERMDLFFWDGSEVTQLTFSGEESEGIANQAPEINDLEQIVWTQYDFCNDPWTSRIMQYSDGAITQVSPSEQTHPQAANLNNRGLITWSLDGIWLWENGEVSMLTDWGGGAKPNDRGEIALSRSYPGDPVPSSELWLYRNGEFYQITDNPHDQGWYNLWIGPRDINEKGEIVYETGRPWFDEAYIYLMALSLEDGHSSSPAEAIDVKRVLP